MTKRINLFLLLIFTLILSGCTLLNAPKKTTQETPSSSPTNAPQESTRPPIAATEAIEAETDFTATFEIYTNGTKRIFTDTKYHNQSSAVYITSANPSLIYVKESQTTWDDFFKTLPFSLTSECLITGTKQTFCSSQTKKLKFFLNEQETPDALEMPIQHGDVLKVIYENAAEFDGVTTG